MYDTWLAPSIIISLASVAVGIGGAFAVVRHQVARLEASVAGMVSRAEYEVQIQAINVQLGQVLTRVDRLTDRLDRYFDTHERRAHP